MIQGIVQAVISRYGSLNSPDFAFAAKLLAEGAWEPLVCELQARLEMEETTDLNSDVSRVFVVKVGGERVATLQLSLVGPYGVYFRHAGDVWKEIFLDAADDARTSEEAFVFQRCVANGVTLLGLDTLRWPVRLRLFDTDPERVRLYQALFSDVDYIPGEFHEAHPT